MQEICVERLDGGRLLGEHGPLAAFLPGFNVRAEQVIFAEAVASCIAQDDWLVAEVGTGCGKTFAYLLPILQHTIQQPRKVIISTGTKYLQDQLFDRDLPLAMQALGVSIKTALLKGRRNYVCRYYFERAHTEALLTDPARSELFNTIAYWMEKTSDGDLSTVGDIEDGSPVWEEVSSTADNCLGKNCPFVSRCFVYQARKAAQEADLIVINHHLLLSDWTLKSENTAEQEHGLLPDQVILVLDEAHQLPEIAIHHFGAAFSSKKTKLLLKEIQKEKQKEAPDLKILDVLAFDLTRSLHVLQNLFLEEEKIGLCARVAPTIVEHLKLFSAQFQELCSVLQTAQARGKGLQLCYERAGGLLNALSLSLAFEDQRFNASDSVTVYWYEVFVQNFVLHITPEDIAGVFQQKLKKMACAAVLSSATLSVSGQFSLFLESLGLRGAKTLQLNSPFDYLNQALLYVPRGLADPGSEDYIDHYIQAVLPVLQASAGRAFLLFTSHHVMQKVYQQLTQNEHYRAEAAAFSLYIQGQESKREMLAHFIADPHAPVLLATAGFWEGVDVRGSQLHCVVIDKIPFGVPSEPLLQAKIERFRKNKRDPFLELQCPEAVLQLKQGAGRLIRDQYDRGVLMICDPRLVARHYGGIFLRSLPPMARTRDLARVQDFFKQSSLRDHPNE